MQHRREIAEHISTLDPNERLLFHGAARLVLSMIVRGGFDSRVSNPTGLFGCGVYFAETAKYSHAYTGRATADSLAGASTTADELISSEGKYAMLLCRVSLGRPGLGIPGLRRPPPGFDSVGDHEKHAVYDNHQAYPEYIIYYS